MLEGDRSGRWVTQLGDKLKSALRRLGAGRTNGRFLIVNADDFGHSVDVNRGIIKAHQSGILTSASLMVDLPAASEAVAYSRAYPNFSLGLHVNLAQSIYRDGKWVPEYQLVPMDDSAAVADAVEQQLKRFRSMVGRNPTHIDSHQHVHKEEPVRSVLLEAACRLSVPLRFCTPGITYRGEYYGQTNKGLPLPKAITVDSMTEILRSLSPGITELGCHPGLGKNLDSIYSSEREEEVKVLCDPRIQKAIDAAGIQLRSFNNLGDPWQDS